MTIDGIRPNADIRNADVLASIKRGCREGCETPKWDPHCMLSMQLAIEVHSKAPSSCKDPVEG